MPQHEQLNVFGRLNATKQHHEFEDRPQGCVHDGKQHSTDYAQPAKILEPRLLSPTRSAVDVLGTALARGQ